MSIIYRTQERFAGTDNFAVLMTDEAPMQPPVLSDLARLCARETALFVQRQPFDPQYCFELFRRAIVERNQRAWELVYTFYTPRVEQWVRRDSAFAATGESEDVFVNAAFARFWASLSSDRFVTFPDLSSLLRYLQVCAHSAIIDHIRSLDADTEELDDERGVDVEQPAADVDAAIDRERLWREIDALLADEAERKMMHDSFVLGLTPRQVQERSPQLFATARDVYRVKQNVLSRLRRDQRLKALAGNR